MTAGPYCQQCLTVGVQDARGASYIAAADRWLCPRHARVVNPGQLASTVEHCMTCTRCHQAAGQPRQRHAERVLCDKCDGLPPIVDWDNPPQVAGTNDDPARAS